LQRRNRKRNFCDFMACSEMARLIDIDDVLLQGSDLISTGIVSA